MISLKQQFARITKANFDEEQRRAEAQAARIDQEFREQITRTIAESLSGYGVTVSMDDISLDAEYCWWNEDIWYTAIVGNQPAQFTMGGRCPICKNRCGFQIHSFSDIERLLREVETDTLVHSACADADPFVEFPV